LSAAAANRAAAADRVAILMYHQVSVAALASFVKYTVTRRAFAAQMRWLASAGYSTLDLPTLTAHRRQGEPVPPKRVIITFDDGFRDCAHYTAPILRSHGFSATYFLVAGLMGGPGTWLRAERGIEPPLMSWDDARALAADGHRCGSHSMTHPRLAEISADACRDELARSRSSIEEQVGHTVRELAYPFGSENERVRAVAAECGYESACTVEIGLSTSADPALALRRVPVLGTDSLIDFKSRVRTGYTVSDRLRALAQSVVGASRTAGNEGTEGNDA
jgi:peptidoglycan/xylan/chitin deacetylase (PgdA/CDA1 family)